MDFCTCNLQVVDLVQKVFWYGDSMDCSSGLRVIARMM